MSGPEDDEEELEPEVEVVAVNAADEDGLRAQKKRIRRDKDRIADLVRGLLANPVGREWMWQILAECHPFSTQFAAGPVGFPDERATWYAQAEQQLGLRFFMTWQMIDPEGVMLMLREHDPRFAKPKRIRKQQQD